MSHALKCPNPSCPFLFDPSQVPPGAVLTCPRCGMRFTLGPAPAGSPPPETAFESPAAPDRNEPAGRPSSTRGKRSAPDRPPANDGRSPLLPILAVLLVVATAVGVGYVVFTRLGTAGPSATDLIFEERNVMYRFPVPNWEKDDESKALFNVNLIGLKRTESAARVAVEARDYQTRNPQPGELREAISERLKPLFDDLDIKEEEGGTLAGQPAMKFTFRGNATGKLGTGIYLGEAYGLAHKGVGYLFIAAAPEGEVNLLSADLDDLRKRLQLLDKRDGWKETSSPVKVLVGQNADYRLTDGDGWWQKVQQPEIEDPKADTVYDAEFKSKVKRDVKPKARVAVLLLDPAGDPVATLKAYLTEQYDKLYGMKTWEPVNEPPLGDAPNAGEAGGVDVMRFKVTGPDPRTTKLVVLSAIQSAGSGGKPVVVGVHAACAIEYQPVWERRLVQLAASLKGG